MVPVFDITFTSGFSGERVDVYINNKKIIRDVSLITNEIVACTTVAVYIFEGDGIFYAQTHIGKRNEKFIKLPSRDKEVKLRITYNKMRMEFKLTKDKGRYILIRKDGKQKLELDQSNRPPIFE